jgi:hypothetical protein
MSLTRESQTTGACNVDDNQRSDAGMKGMKILGLTLMAVFMFGAFTATAALAAQEDIYKVEGTKLASGESQEIKAKIAEEFTLKGKKSIFESVTKCTVLELEKGAVIEGGQPGKSSKEVIKFPSADCTAEVKGIAKCSSVSITNAETKNELVEIVKPTALAGKLASLFTPASGTKFSTVELKSCGLAGTQTAEVTGTSAARVEPEMMEALEGNLTWNEKEEITEVKKFGASSGTAVGLKSNGNLATLNGKAAVSLASGKKWGAF